MHCPICHTDNSDISISCAACGAPLGAVAVAPDALASGAKLQSGNFTIEKVLGQGGFGITYLVADNSLGRRAAIKEFFPASCARRDATVQPAGNLTLAAYHEARRRFLEEARHLARFHHSGIVAVHSVFEENNTAYMVMEYLQGQPLGAVLHERGGRLDEDEALGIMRKVGSSLEVVHAAGLLHRDIKPDNIVACADGRVVLIDFGTARDFAAGSTQGHTVAVTPGYAPLEQYASRAARGIYTDVYGLAATLYFLLTGEVPTAASDRAMGVLLPPVEQLNPHIGHNVARAIMQGLQIEVAKRPQSVREFIELLDGQAATTAWHDSTDWDEDDAEDEVVPTAQNKLTDADILTYVATHRRELLDSPDPGVQKFLQLLAVDSAASRPPAAPSAPVSAWIDPAVLSTHIQARHDMLNPVHLAATPPGAPTQQSAPAKSLSPAPHRNSKTSPANSPFRFGCLSLFGVLLVFRIFTAADYNARHPVSRVTPIPPAIYSSPVEQGREPNFGGFKPQSSPPEADFIPPYELFQRSDEWSKAWSGRNVQQAMSFYAPQVRVYPKPGSALNFQQWQAYLQKTWAEKKAVSFTQSQRPSTQVNGNQVIINLQQVEQETPQLFHYWTRQQTWEKQQDRWMIVEDRFVGSVGTGHYKFSH